jgi:hypothetical protein
MSVWMATLDLRVAAGDRIAFVRRAYVEYLGNSVELAAGETIVGRDIACALRLDDPGVSRRHLRIVKRGEDVTIEDLGSSNGTYVNGTPVVGPTPLHDGDMIVLSTRVLTMHSTNEHVMEETQPGMKVAAPRAADDSVPIADCRRHARCTLSVAMQYSSNELEVDATTRDLSESGVFVCSPVLDQVGTECRVMLYLDEGHLLATGIVRRVVEHDADADQPVGLGVEFVGLEEHEREWLRGVVERSTVEASAR